MSIMAQCCGMVLLLIIFCFYGQQKNIRLHTRNAFLWAMWVIFANVTLDILSVLVIRYMNELPFGLVVFISKLYLVTLPFVSLSALLYVCTDLSDSNRKGYRRFSLGFEGIAAVGALVIFLLPINFFRDEYNVVLYTDGPSVLATYIFAVFFLIVTLAIMLRQKNKINPRRRWAVLLWMFFWTGAALIQFFNGELLLVGFGASVGMVLLYLMLENPETNLDRMTGLFNQGTLMQYMRQRYGSGEKFSGVMLVYAHSVYDQISTETERRVAVELAVFLSEIPGALVFKNSTDELVMLFEETCQAEDAMKAIRGRFEKGWGDSSIYLSEEFYYLPDSDIADGAEEIMSLFRYARLNQIEFAEHHCVRIDETLFGEMHEEKRVERLIADAMEQDRVEVFYQPIYSTKERRFTSAEALVRIRDEEGKIVPPGVFVDVAEKNGMILPLGQIIFEQVCRFVRDHDLQQLGIHYIESNLSVVQCAYERLAETYIGIMKKYDTQPSTVNLEITESASLSEKRVLLENMKRLMDYGVSFSLDDFGTGQSNLNYIIDMPVDIVKFDHGMTQAYFSDDKARYVMDAAMHMIHGMGLSIVSEGVETKEQYEEMERLGISYIQGYYFSKPLPEDEFLAFLKKNNRKYAS